jgi:hypothetical protein
MSWGQWKHIFSLVFVGGAHPSRARLIYFLSTRFCQQLMMMITAMSLNMTAARVFLESHNVTYESENLEIGAAQMAQYVSAADLFLQ